MILEYDTIILGSSLNALLLATQKFCPVIFSDFEKPFRFDYLDPNIELEYLKIPQEFRQKSLTTHTGQIDVGMPKYILWERLMFMLSAAGYAPLSNLCKSIRILDNKIICSNEYSKIAEIRFNECIYIGDKNVSVPVEQKGVANAEYLCYDWVAFNKGGKHEIDFIRTNDKWLNLSQGFSDGQDLNHYGAVSQGDGTYDFTVTFNGPMMWQVYYRWGFMDVSLGAEVEESGGGLGGHPRIRYIRQDPDADCAWPSSYNFQLDTVFATDEDLVNAEVWDVNGICLNYMDNEREASLPIQFTLSDNYPNPFNPTTQLDFSLPINSDISFRVFSIKGAEIYSYNETAVPAGNYKLTWAGKDRFGRSLPSGVYLYEFKAGDKFHKVKKMTLLK